MRVRSFRARTAGERDGDGAATVTTPSGIVIGRQAGVAGEAAEEEASEQRERKRTQAHVREPQCGIDMHPRVHVEAAEEPRQ